MLVFYKIGFVLNGFAQMEATVSILSTFEVGWAHVPYLGALNAFRLAIFPTQVGFGGM